MASLLEGSAFVSGAASGIGEQTAYAFAKHGITKLALADINLEGLEQTAATLREKWPHAEVLTLKMDVTDAQDVKDGMAQVAAKFGRLDVAVNNAGVGGPHQQLHELDDQAWQKVLNVNLNGVYRCQKEELALMVRQDDLGPRRGRGVIINMSSLYGIRGPQSFIHQTAYSTSKHAVMGMTKADAHSYSGSNIRINAICPGFAEMAMGSELKGAVRDDHISHTPLRRLAEPEEIADSIVFLASPMSSFVNGTGLVADGGFSSA